MSVLASVEIAKKTQVIKAKSYENMVISIGNSLLTRHGEASGAPLLKKVVSYVLPFPHLELNLH